MFHVPRTFKPKKQTIPGFFNSIPPSKSDSTGSIKPNPLFKVTQVHSRHLFIQLGHRRRGFSSLPSLPSLTSALQLPSRVPTFPSVPTPLLPSLTFSYAFHLSIVLPFLPFLPFHSSSRALSTSRASFFSLPLSPFLFLSLSHPRPPDFPLS